MEEACLLTLCLSSCSVQVYLPQDGAVYSEVIPPTSITNEDSLLQTWIQVDLIGDWSESGGDSLVDVQSSIVTLGWDTLTRETNQDIL